MNDAIAGTPLADRELETIVRTAYEKRDRALFNNAAQTWNHGFYWNSLSPRSTVPGSRLSQAIERDFGSAAKLTAALAEVADGHFASGWAWLVLDHGKLTIYSTQDADTPLTSDAIPLLTIDVWEHAYYLDVKNKRPDYVDAVVTNCLNWDFASENFERDAAWTYPDAAVVQPAL